jgi:O-antigen ligase
MNILPVIFGSGLGSSAVINSLYNPDIGEILNPHSQLVRSLFESGIVGTFFFIMSFLYPIQQLTKYFAPKNRHNFIVLTLLLIGCFMGHRSVAPFIYLGIFIAAISPLQYRNIETTIS